MSEPMTVGELQSFLSDVDDGRVVYLIASGALHDCVGAEEKDATWNNGDFVHSVELGGRGSGLDDPRQEEADDAN
jgi:hypothetical protein